MSTYLPYIIATIAIILIWIPIGRVAVNRFKEKKSSVTKREIYMFSALLLLMLGALIFTWISTGGSFTWN